MKEKVLVFGAGGMLAHALLPLLQKEYDVVGFAHAEADIADLKKGMELARKHRPGWIVNLAAYTDVDGCEKNVELAFRVNGEGARGVAEAAKAVRARLIHLSTDFVFDGAKKKPYVETDPAAPQSTYARSKYEGERGVRQVLPEKEHLIVRTSWLYGPNGKNFVDTIVKAGREKPQLRVVDDQVGRPTYTKDLAQGIVALMKLGASDTVHFANQGECSWYVFACEILRVAGIATPVKPISSAELNRPAKRPSYSVLSTEKYEKLTGKSIRPWQETLKEYLSGSPIHRS